MEGNRLIMRRDGLAEGCGSFVVMIHKRNDSCPGYSGVPRRSRSDVAKGQRSSTEHRRAGRPCRGRPVSARQGGIAAHRESSARRSGGGFALPSCSRRQHLGEVVRSLSSNVARVPSPLVSRPATLAGAHAAMLCLPTSVFIAWSRMASRVVSCRKVTASKPSWESTIDLKPGNWSALSESFPAGLLS